MEQGNDVLFEPNNNYVLTGESHSSDGDVMMNYGDEDMWIFKIAPRISLGIFDPESVPFTFQFNDDNLIVKSPVSLSGPSNIRLHDV